MLSGKTPRKRIGGSVCRNNLKNPESWSLTFCLWILKDLNIALIWHLTFYWSPLWRRPWEPSWGWGWWWWRWRRSGRRGTGRWLSTEAGGQSWKIDRWTEKEKLFLKKSNSRAALFSNYVSCPKKLWIVKGTMITMLQKLTTLLIATFKPAEREVF